MRLGWILASIVLLALLVAPVHVASGDVAEEFSVENESNPVEWNNKGVALYLLGKYDEAIQAYDEAIRLDPEMAMAWNNKGWALHKLGKYDEAIQAYDKAIELKPEYAHAWNNKGETLRSQGNYADAILALDEAIRLDPKNAIVWYNKGLALSDQGKYEEAIDATNHAIDLDPQLASAWSNKGNVLAEQGKYEEAIEAYNHAIDAYNHATDLDPQLASAWNNKGNVLAEQGKYEEAIVAYNRSIDLDPQSAQPRNNKGNVLAEQGKYEEAIELYKKAIQLNPKIPITWYNKGNALESLNHSAEAAMAYSLGREMELNSETKRGIFAVFLVIYSALAVGGYVLTRRFRKYSTSIVILSINSLGFLTVVWVLSGFFDILLVGQFLIGGVLMVAISAVLWSLSGFPANPWMDQLALEIEDLNRKCPRLSWFIRAVGLLAVLLFASMATVFYFRLYLSTEISMVDFLKIAFLSIFLVGLFVTLPPIWFAMISKNLDRGTRDFLLIFQFSHLGVSGLYLGLILWILEIGSFDHPIPLGNIEFPRSPLFLGIVMFLLAFTIIGPYISGSKRASRWNVALLEKERSWLEVLLNVLDFPTPSLYVPKLQKIQDEIKDDETISGQEEFNRIIEMIAQFEELEGDKEEIKETARIYADSYRLRRDEIAGMIEREGQFRPKFWIALAIIFTPILGQILASIINLILTAMIETNLGGLITSTPTLPLP